MKLPTEEPKYPNALTKQPPARNINAWEDLTIADDYMFKLA